MNDDLLKPTRIIYVKRRSIALIINKYGELIVRAPIRSTIGQINAFINEKSNWIINKRVEMLNSVKNNTLNLSDGSDFEILGTKYTILFQDCKTAKIKNQNLILPPINTINALISLLKRELKLYLSSKVADLANYFGFEFKSLSITSATTSWGSCGANNSLNFTYKLAMCPKPVVDYIIVHELCHTKIKNHSTKFWAEVKKCYPEYKHCERWLKTNRAIINKI